MSYIDHLIKSDFLKQIIYILTGTGVFDKQECHLLWDFNIQKPFVVKKSFSKKIYRTDPQNFSCLKKCYLDACFSFPQEQSISVPIRATNKTITTINHVLNNSFQIVSRFSIVRWNELSIFDHDLIYSKIKTSFLSLTNKVSFGQMKNYAKEKIIELLKKMIFQTIRPKFVSIKVIRPFIFKLNEQLDLLCPRKKDKNEGKLKLWDNFSNFQEL